MSVNVGVALVFKSDKILVGFNPKWRAYTLPMTKKQDRKFWLYASLRAAGEWIPSDIDLVSLGYHGNVDGTDQSGRDGASRSYRYSISTVLVRDEARVSGDGRWLAAEEIVRPPAGLRLTSTVTGLIQTLGTAAEKKGLGLCDYVRSTAAVPLNMHGHPPDMA